MKNKKSVPTKEEIKKYIAQLQASVGNKEKIEQVLENQDMLLAYLSQIGVEKSWLDRAAIVEMTKQKMASILLKGKNVQVLDNRIEYGKGKMSVENGVFYIYNTGSEEECIKFEEAQVKENFDKDGEERFEKAPKNADFIKFSEINQIGKIEKYIDRNGIVQLEKTYIKDIWGLLPKETYVREMGNKIMTTRLSEIEGEVIINRSEAKDFGALHTAKPITSTSIIDMMKKYPAYRAWFEAKKFDIDKIAEAIEEEQKDEFEALKSGYEKVEEFKPLKDEFNKNEQTLGEFYAYLATLSPLAKKAFISAVNAKYRKNSNTAKSINEKLSLAMSGELDVEHDDSVLEQFNSLEELNKAARLKVESKPKEKSEDEAKFDFLKARKEIIQENWNSQIKLKGYHNRVYHQHLEISTIKSAVAGIPLIGKKLVRKLKKDEMEK